MNRANTTNKDIEVRLALTEQGFGDIKRRLDLIETDIRKLGTTVNRGLGAWKALMCLGTLSGIFSIFIK